jgi:hypothetical protein
MVRIFAAVVAAALAVGFPASATANPGTGGVVRSSGMSRDYPVGTCLDVPNSTPRDFWAPIDVLRYVGVVPCSDPKRDYRVVSQVPQESLCGPDTNRVYYTRDVVVLCTVDDHV